MVFGFFKRKKKQAQAPQSPLAAFDAVIEELERQGAQLRRSAATLFTVRGQLGRDVERYRARLEDLTGRIGAAQQTGDLQAVRVLERDLTEATQLLEVTEHSLTRVASDAELLTEAGADLALRLSELKVERQSAAARLHAGTVVSLALRQRMEKFQQVVALDAARDEVERAHQLAQLYREERAQKGAAP